METELLTQYNIAPLEVLVVSILVLYLGIFLNRKIRVLADNYIPPAVTGGLICSAIVAMNEKWMSSISLAMCH